MKNGKLLLIALIGLLPIAIYGGEGHEATGSAEAAIVKQTEAYMQDGDPPDVLQEVTRVRVPFGHSEPRIVCSPLRSCDIELQEGEEMMSTVLGDEENWNAQKLFSANGRGVGVDHVIVGPTKHGTTTNVVIGTSRRTYHVLLVSPEKGYEYTNLAFYYPDETVKVWKTAQELSDKGKERIARRKAFDLSAVNFRDVHVDYKIKGKAPWKPTRVFDDGSQVHILMPKGLQELPTVMVAQEKGAQLEVVNFHPSTDGRWLVVDGVFEEIALISGVGKKQRKVRVLRKAG